MTKAQEKKLEQLKLQLRQLNAEIETQKRRRHHRISVIASGDHKDTIYRSWRVFILDLEEQAIAMEKEIIAIEEGLDPTQQILNKQGTKHQRGQDQK